MPLPAYADPQGTLHPQGFLFSVHGRTEAAIGMFGQFDKPYLPKVFADVSYPESQPSHFVDGHEPALLLLYGNQDTEVYPRNIVNMTRIVRQQGGEVESHIYDGVDHAGILAALSIPYRSRMGVMDDIASFLDRHNQPRIELR